MEPIILDEHVTSGKIHWSQLKDFVFFSSLKKNNALDFIFFPDIYVKAGISSMLLYEFSKLRDFLF